MDIGVWGDSIAYGSSDESALGWVGRLRKARTPDLDQDVVYNRGICGDTSRGVLERFTTEAAAFVYPLDLVMLAIGMNDSLERKGTGRGVPLHEFESNIRTLITRATKIVPKVVVIGITNVDETRTSPFAGSNSGKRYLNSTIQEYNRVLQALAEESGTTFIPTFGILESDELADGLHPNAAGYEKLFKVISEALDI